METDASTSESTNFEEISVNLNENISEDIVSNAILCVIWKSSRLGACYYAFDEKLLYVYDEMIDLSPHFIVSHTLYRELNPKYILTFGSLNDGFVKVLIDILTTGQDTTVSSDGLKVLPPNFYVLPIKEYTYDMCKSTLLQTEIASNRLEESDAKKEQYLHSLINFDYRMSVHATGALIRYLDKNWAHFNANRDDLRFLHINQISMKNHVLIDTNSFAALQIFHQRSHDANFKHGLQSANREGLSIYKLFSSGCKSKLGQYCMRNILLNPITKLDELNERLDFIEFSMQLSNLEYIESLQENFKNLIDINLVLTKIQNSRANARDWSILHKTIYHAIFINELSAPYRDKCHLIGRLNMTITVHLLGLERSIINAIDFTVKNVNLRPTIKLGLDENLDAKKLKREDITKHVSAAARVAVGDLPDFISACSVVYLPEMGHLICLEEWEPNCNPETLQEFGYEFIFQLRGTLHYKNPICVQLDRYVGDLNAEIIAHENRILHRLSGFILKYNKDIREPLKILALMDCLISISKIALQYNYVRPNLNDERIHEIEKCRHPLMEIVSTFEPNDYYSGGDKYSHIKIITGPNGSGKSIYLKQIALIIYLAHIGSFVPAKKANIAMVHSIHTRVQATESASVRLSSFMIDIIQTAQALNNAKSSSLILLDEFGRGTTGDEGFALLVGALKQYEAMGLDCPHILVSTHYQKIDAHLNESSIVDHLKMDHIKKDGVLCFLYKLTPGVSGSFAFEIAEEIGLNPAIIERARNIFDCLKMGELIEPFHGKYNISSDNMKEYLLDINIPETD